MSGVGVIIIKRHSWPPPPPLRRLIKESQERKEFVVVFDARRPDCSVFVVNIINPVTFCATMTSA